MTAKRGERGVVHSKGNGSMEESRLGFWSGWKSCPPPNLELIKAECLSAAEEAAEQLLSFVRPTLDSEEKRCDVIDYVQQLVQSRLNLEVVSYGSVPLKTYLPDGDIDLTILDGNYVGESLVLDVLTLLQDEEQNENAECKVKDTQFIDAEVKLVKCFVRNFVIDISFNQLGGLSTLCFLEQVDRLVGRDHIFKRSIILIKTWCYYESRILGAHHGLISTYALEVLVLYIFHHFHSSLSGPLSALYRFLDYYSQFDWENYCISLKGPVCKSSLPDIVVKIPEDGCNDLLLSEEFLEKCLDLFSVYPRGIESNAKAFQPKHLNIIDPLKGNNNLGRSVHRGNFYRIRSAFKLGAHKLGQVLLRPRDKIGDEIGKFFSNTRARHNHQYRSSVRPLTLDFGDSNEEFSSTESLLFPVECLSEDNASVGMEQTLSFDPTNEIDRYSIREVSPETTSEACYSTTGVKYNLSTSNLYLKNGSFECSSKFSTDNGGSEGQHVDLPSDSERFGLNSWLENRDELSEINNTYRWCVDNSEGVVFASSSVAKSDAIENLSLNFRELDSASVGGESDALDPLADLTGDYDGNIRSLLRGQLCHGFSSSSAVARNQNKKPWDIVRQSMPLKMNNFSQTSSHKIATTERAPCATFHFDANLKTRGTGTYFPDASVVCIERRGKNKALGIENRFDRHGQINGLYSSGESNGSDEGACAQRTYYGRKRRSDLVSRSVGGGTSPKNGLSRNAPCRIEFGSIGNIGEDVLSGSARVRGSTMRASFKPDVSAADLMRHRFAGQSIHLMNEDEFPPLCQ